MQKITPFLWYDTQALEAAKFYTSIFPNSQIHGEEQFENTMRAFLECQFDYAYIARYSPRRETYAAKMLGHIPAEIKAQRWDRLNSLMFEIIQNRNEMMIGREEVILVSKIDEEDGTLSGRTRNFREVFLPKDETIKL